MVSRSWSIRNEPLSPPPTVATQSGSTSTLYRSEGRSGPIEATLVCSKSSSLTAVLDNISRVLDLSASKRSRYGPAPGHLSAKITKAIVQSLHVLLISCSVRFSRPALHVHKQYMYVNAARNSSCSAPHVKVVGFPKNWRRKAWHTTAAALMQILATSVSAPLLLFSVNCVLYSCNRAEL